MLFLFHKKRKKSERNKDDVAVEHKRLGNDARGGGIFGII